MGQEYKRSVFGYGKAKEKVPSLIHKDAGVELIGLWKVPEQTAFRGSGLADFSGTVPTEQARKSHEHLHDKAGHLKGK